MSDLMLFRERDDDCLSDLMLDRLALGELSSETAREPRPRPIS